MSGILHAAVAALLGLLALSIPPASAGSADTTPAITPQPVRIGVLAKRGTQIALARWSPTADYLSETIPDFRFTIVPLSFEQISPAIRERNIDFLLANSAIYVQTEHGFHVFRIATLINRRGDHPVSRFGGVIFTRRENRDIEGLADLKQRSFAAVDRNSFGGYLMARREFSDQGIDTERDLHTRFFGTHDAVVHAVLNGEADAGTVRTDTLERMAADHLIDLQRIKLLHVRTEDAFPYRLSTRLYPEWPMAALPHVPNDLVKAVSRALLGMPPDHPAALAGHSFGWTVPANYQQVHELFAALNLPPHAMPPPSLKAWAIHHPLATAITASLLLLLLISVIRLSRLNRQLLASRRKLAHAVSEQQQTSAQLADNLARLKQSEEKFVSLAESAFDAIVMLDPRGRVEFWNLAAEKIFGFLAAEAIGMKTDQWLLPRAQADDRSNEILLSIGHIDSPLPGTNLELVALRRDGEQFPAEAALSSVCLNDGWHVICVLRDITRRKQLEAERRRLESELGQHHKMAALAQLAEGIAHEINTPMQTIGNNLEFLREAFDDTQALLATHEAMLSQLRQREELAGMVAACDRAREDADPDFIAEEAVKAIAQSLDGAEQVKRIVRSMQVFANPDSPAAETTDVGKLIHDLLAITRKRWSPIAEVQFDAGEHPIEIECFPGELSQALLNLLINAVQAIEERKDPPPGRIEIRLRQLETAVEIRIADNGRGIPPEAREQVFNPFFSTRGVGRGSGQGLTHSHDVVVRGHHGSLTFETEMERGTEFILRLPKRQAENHREPALCELPG
ncbi:MAG: PhnD/SsuA/transferrin family substrate-binding protein [Candidatus Thiodiazotropha sp.]